MEKKTKERLERKFLALPLHHIDTNILIESFEETKFGVISSNYLNKIGYNYRGRISLSALGEFLLIVLRDYVSVERELTIRKLYDLLGKRKITFLTPTKTTFNIATKVMELDFRIEPTDALHYATAVQENAKSFVTLDKILLENYIIENEFGVKIKHPEFFI